MRQRGQAQLYILIAVAAAFLLLLGLVHHYRAQLLITEAQFESYKDKQAALAEAAKARKAIEDAAHDKQIQIANSERDDALKRMRDAEQRASRSRVPLTPAAATGSDQICFGQKALSAAVERYRGRVRGLAQSGDEAQIDAAALLKAWPKPVK